MADLSVVIRPFDEADWNQVLGFADTVVPYHRAGNREWLSNRQQFAASVRLRRHYAALGRDGRMIAYGAIEQQPYDSVFRLFIVPSTAELWDTAGEALFERLARDLDELGATLVWMRESARDIALVRFAERHGFQLVDAFDHPRSGGSLRIVRLEKHLTLGG